MASLPHEAAIVLVFNVRREYLQNLVGYLADFHERTQPLYQLQKQMAKVRQPLYTESTCLEGMLKA